MFRSLALTGVDARLYWAVYTVAATIRGYTITRDGAGYVLRATVVDKDARFDGTQRPLELITTHAGGEWIWPVLECRLTDQTITGRLRPPEA